MGGKCPMGRANRWGCCPRMATLGGHREIGGPGGVRPLPALSDQMPQGACFTKVESGILNETQRQPIVPGHLCRPLGISAARKLDDLIMLGD